MGSVGDINKMSDAIWAIFNHTIIQRSMTLEDQYKLCPREGWCKFWADKKSYSEGKRLPAVFGDLLKPIFTRLSNWELLSRCQGGFTQNQNEAINQVLWSRCLKTRFCGYYKLKLAECDTIAHSNGGATA